MTSELTHLNIAEALEGLKKRQFSAAELTNSYLNIIEKHKHLNAYILINKDALKAAEDADKRIRQNEGRFLEGIPMGIKDLFCTKGMRTTACSKILSNFIPPYESTVTQRLWDKGALNLGKLNMDEFAMGSTTATSYFGPTTNPWQRKKDKKPLTPGGSSGGSATAVAGGLAIAALGSDTGGSIRQPAAFCGIVGIKPTYGLCSRFGMVAFASSLDQAGPLTRTVKDAAIILESIAGYDPLDATSLNVSIPSYSQNLKSDVKGKRVAILKEFMEGLNPEMKDLIEQSIKILKDGGATIEEVSFPLASYTLPIYYIIAPAEASSNLARYDGVRYGFRADADTLEEMYMKTRQIGFGAEVKRRLLIGTYVLSSKQYDAYYMKAQKAKQLISEDFDKIFKTYDLILTPTTPTEAFALDEQPKCPKTVYLNDIYTVTVNLAGLPGISIPFKLSSNGLPLAAQLIGPKLSEQTLLNSAQFIEDQAKFPSLLGGAI